jgi:hypothetical protein
VACARFVDQRSHAVTTAIAHPTIATCNRRANIAGTRPSAAAAQGVAIREWSAIFRPGGTGLAPPGVSWVDGGRWELDCVAADVAPSVQIEDVVNGACLDEPRFGDAIVVRVIEQAEGSGHSDEKSGTAGRGQWRVLLRIGWAVQAWAGVTGASHGVAAHVCGIIGSQPEVVRREPAWPVTARV